MAQNITCPVCKKESSAADLRCEHCRTPLALCTLFSGENAYNEWLKNINRKKDEYFGQLSAELLNNGSNLSVTYDRLAFCNNKTNKAVILRFGYPTPAVYENVKQVSLSGLYTVFLKTDGTVFSEGDNEYGQRNLSDLKNIAFVATSTYCTYAVSEEGTVTARGITPFSEAIAGWSDIKSVVCTNDCVIGLRGNGSVCSAASKESAVYKYVSAVNSWTDVKKLQIGENYIVGITNRNTVLYSGEDDEKAACTNFRSVTDIAADSNYVIGRTYSGDIVLAGKTSRFTDFGRVNASKWKHVSFVACACGKYIIAGITSSGELLLEGNVNGTPELSRAFTENYRDSVTK